MPGKQRQLLTRTQRGQAVLLLYMLILLPLTVLFDVTRESTLRNINQAKAHLAALDASRSASDALEDSQRSGHEKQSAVSAGCAAMDRHQPFKLLSIVLGESNSVSVIVGGYQGDERVVGRATYTKSTPTRLDSNNIGDETPSAGTAGGAEPDVSDLKSFPACLGRYGVLN